MTRINFDLSNSAQFISVCVITCLSRLSIVSDDMALTQDGLTETKTHDSLFVSQDIHQSPSNKQDRLQLFLEHVLSSYSFCWTVILQLLIFLLLLLKLTLTRCQNERSTMTMSKYLLNN